MKVLTFGCSYSQVVSITDDSKYDWTWPVFLDKSLNGTVADTEDHQGMGASGNESISRKVIYYVDKALKSHKAEDLLIGIIWSGCDRHSLVLRESKRQYDRTNLLPVCGEVPTYEDFNNKLAELNEPIPGAKTIREVQLKIKQFYNNPYRIASDEFNHITLNSHWSDYLTVNYYENFVDHLSSLIKTCEQILRTEWFLKQRNVKYFMCAYDFDTFIYAGINDTHLYSEDCPALSLQVQGDQHTVPKDLLNHPDVKYLYDMIDKDYWLPVDSLGEWCNHVSEFDFPRKHDPHPGWEQHQDFVNKVILPFLLKKYNISQYNI